jgi:hypothetical protein
VKRQEDLKAGAPVSGITLNLKNDITWTEMDSISILNANLNGNGHEILVGDEQKPFQGPLFGSIGETGQLENVKITIVCGPSQTDAAGLLVNQCDGTIDKLNVNAQLIPNKGQDMPSSVAIFKTVSETAKLNDLNMSVYRGNGASVVKVSFCENIAPDAKIDSLEWSVFQTSEDLAPHKEIAKKEKPTFGINDLLEQADNKANDTDDWFCTFESSKEFGSNQLGNLVQQLKQVARWFSSHTFLASLFGEPLNS